MRIPAEAARDMVPTNMRMAGNDILETDRQDRC